MGKALPAEKVKPFVAVMYSAGFAIEPIVSLLRDRLGEAECSWGPVDFSWTDYYDAEMGGGLKKLYLCYARLIDREELPALKLWTNALEAEHAGADGRRVNADPGYLARDKLVLASTKDFYHRLYLGSGIYGEVTLHLREGKYRFFSWTYPDFKEPALQAMLLKARASLVGGLRKRKVAS